LSGGGMFLIKEYDKDVLPEPVKIDRVKKIM
jgi:hypothetical protein